MVRDNGIHLLKVNGVNLPIRSYRFDDHGVPLHVFYCDWDARSSYENEKAANEEDWTARGRVRAAMRGQREIGAQMLKVVVWGYGDDVEAGVALERQLEQIVGAGCGRRCPGCPSCRRGLQRLGLQAGGEEKKVSFRRTCKSSFLYL
jgi:hypothetical protein